MEALGPIKSTTDKIITMLLLLLANNSNLSPSVIDGCTKLFSKDDIAILAEDKTAALKCSNPYCFLPIKPIKYARFQLKIGKGGIVPADNFGFCRDDCKKLFYSICDKCILMGNTHHNKSIDSFKFIEEIEDINIRNQYNKLVIYCQKLVTPTVKVKIVEHIY